MSETTNNDIVLDIWLDVTRALEGVSRQIEWAEDEIQQAMERLPSERDVLYHSFPLLNPTHKLMATEFVYRSHCREILERLVTGADTRPGTAAEVCCLCYDMCLRVPLRSPIAGLYLLNWTRELIFLSHSSPAWYNLIRAAAVPLRAVPVVSTVRRTWSASLRRCRSDWNSATAAAVAAVMLRNAPHTIPMINIVLESFTSCPCRRGCLPGSTMRREEATCHAKHFHL